MYIKKSFYATCCLLFMLVALPAVAQSTDDLVFLHHSCGSNWLNAGLHTALLNKDYIDERNDITYGTVLTPDTDRPALLGEIPGNNTDMNHWISWFNDYLEGIKTHDCEDGENKIIMYKSCYPISNIYNEGTEPGNPFSATRHTVNYKAVYRHPGGPGNSYINDIYTYYPLNDVFAAYPNTLFIAVTAPPRHYGTTDATNDAEAQRARDFNNWLKNDWLDSYNAAHPGLNNVAVFDWFNILAYPEDHATHPNRLREEYGGNENNSHPNTTANVYSTQLFATNEINFLDTVWDLFNSTVPVELSAFQANDTGQGVDLTWTTLSENNNLGWDLYRAESGKGTDYVKINPSIITGHGTTLERHDYVYTDQDNLKSNTSYKYLLQSIDTNGHIEKHGPVTVTTGGKIWGIPDSFVMGNYPNPFNSSTTIRYHVPESGALNISVYDIRGARVAELAKGSHNAGDYEILWDATGLSSGNYFCRIVGAGLNSTIKLLYLQ